MLIINLQTVDPMLIPLYFAGSDFDPFPFHSVLSREFPQESGKSRLDQRFEVILCITSSKTVYACIYVVIWLFIYIYIYIYIYLYIYIFSYICIHIYANLPVNYMYI